MLLQFAGRATVSGGRPKGRNVQPIVLVSLCRPSLPAQSIHDGDQLDEPFLPRLVLDDGRIHFPLIVRAPIEQTATPQIHWI